MDTQNPQVKEDFQGKLPDRLPLRPPTDANPAAADPIPTSESSETIHNLRGQIDNSDGVHRSTSSPPSAATLSDRLALCENDRRQLQDLVSKLQETSRRMRLQLEERRNQATRSAKVLKKWFRANEANRDGKLRFARAANNKKKTLEAGNKALNKELAQSRELGADCHEKLMKLNAELEALGIDSGSQISMQDSETESKGSS